MPLVGVKANAGAFGLGWSAVLPGEELGGMVLLTPTSVDITGGGSETATTNPNGSVEFSACATLSLNGVFSADYDNYMIAMRQTASASTAIHMRLRVGGADNSTASSYVRQYLEADSTSVGAARQTYDFLAGVAYAYNTQRAGETISVYGPNLAQPTAFRSVSAHDYNSAIITDVAGTHNQSTAYDGFTIYPASGNITGLVSVYGLVGA